MTVGEQIKLLVKADNYLSARMETSDEFIGFIRDMMPRDYEYIKEKEEAYQKLIKLYYT